MLMNRKEDFEIVGKLDELTNGYIGKITIEEIIKIEDIMGNKSAQFYGESEDMKIDE